MTFNISQFLIDRYSPGPSSTKVTQVASLQQTIHDVLGDEDYDTFLQGSYRNGTALSDINEVDIIARRKATKAPLGCDVGESLQHDRQQAAEALPSLWRGLTRRQVRQAEGHEP